MFSLVQRKSSIIPTLKSDIARLNKQVEYLNVALDALLNYKMTDIPFEQLIEKWPVAVAEDLICNTSAEDLRIRAENILNYFVADSITGKKVYIIPSDEQMYHCCVDRQVVSMPCDNDKHPELSGQYDAIVLYDCLDYLINPELYIANLKNHLVDGGKVYIRFHPWCSRSGTHLYKSINKAYFHLVFSPDEIQSIFGQKVDFTYPVTRPIETYDKWVSGYKVLHKNVVCDDIEDFFYSDDKIIKRICSHYETFNGLLLPSEHLSVLFVDYVLQK